MQMLNFTVGPVMSDNDILQIGSQQVPYFRTAEFSEVMLENEQIMLRLAHAPADSRVVFITGSGTASMEAAVMNVLTPSDRAIVINGGSFGQRFVELCQIHDIPYTEVNPGTFQPVTEAHLAPLADAGYTALLVNVGETSTGVLYDMALLSRFCREHGLLLITDTISSFLADPYDMQALGADVMITGSQKALACPPGISCLVLAPRALERIARNRPRTMYLNLQDALKNGERGQTPFTPAVSILLQIHQRLRDIEAHGGAEAECQRMAALAADFRSKLGGLPFTMATRVPSNAVTALCTHGFSAYDVFLTLKDQYHIWVCPNGGELRDTVLRVGHLGALTTDDNSRLVDALHDMQRHHLLP